MPAVHDNEEKRWYVMRDLRRANARQHAWQYLAEQGFEVFTPTKTLIRARGGKKVKEETAVIPDLLFVYSDRRQLDPVVEENLTLQYRYARGKGYRQPLTVATADMNRFIAAVRSVDNPEYYTPDEITPSMQGRLIRLHCEGNMDGLEGRLVTVRGSRKRRIMVELRGYLTAVVEINPEYIQFIDEEDK